MDFVDIFEQKLCEYTGAKYAVCTDCCTNAILISVYLKQLLDKNIRGGSLVIPSRTYMSVPMTLKLFGFKILFDCVDWTGNYSIKHLDDCGRLKDTNVIDSAVDFREYMFEGRKTDDLVCLSFQQKKRLNLGRGGAILTNNRHYYKLLKRMVHDGRNPKISHKEEIENYSKKVILGFHSYMEPEKAARGIQILNQPQILPEYVIHSSLEYPDLTTITNIF